MQRKPGGYRKPSEQQRDASRISKDDFNRWFQQIWTIPGASTKQHPAPFPLELALRIVRMFSFEGDTVLDPFCGSGTSMIAALKTGRSSIGVETDPDYYRMVARYLKAETSDFFLQRSSFLKKRWFTMVSALTKMRSCIILARQKRSWSRADMAQCRNGYAALSVAWKGKCSGCSCQYFLAKLVWSP